MATVNLSWTAPTTGGAPTSYTLYRKSVLTATADQTAPTAAEIKADDTADGNPAFNSSIPSTDTSYSDTSTSSSYTYYYTIAGVNSGGEGALSNVATAVVP